MSSWRAMRRASSLLGSEVKSIRDGRISLKESYAEIRDGEVYLLSCHISHYEPANRLNHDPLRERKLLLHQREIKRLTGKIKERGFTLVPTQVRISDRGKVKVELALARGKKDPPKTGSDQGAGSRSGDEGRDQAF